MEEVSSPSRPAPAPDPISEVFWESLRSRRLVVQRCGACRRWQHPPKVNCRTCGSCALGYEPVSGRASLHSYTVLADPPGPGFVDRVPLVVGVVELAEQPRLLLVTNVVGAGEGDLRLGMSLQVDFEPLDAGTVIPVFRPVDD